MWTACIRKSWTNPAVHTSSSKYKAATWKCEKSNLNSGKMGKKWNCWSTECQHRYSESNCRRKMNLNGGKKWRMLGMEDQTLLYFSEGELSSTFVVHLSALLSASVFPPPHFLQFCTLISCVHQNFNKKSETIIEHMGRWIFVKPVNCVARRPDWSHQYYPARKCRGKCRAKKKGGIEILILCLRTQREDWKQRPEISAFPQLHRL